MQNVFLNHPFFISLNALRTWECCFIILDKRFPNILWLQLDSWSRSWNPPTFAYIVPTLLSIHLRKDDKIWPLIRIQHCSQLIQHRLHPGPMSDSQDCAQLINGVQTFELSQRNSYIRWINSREKHKLEICWGGKGILIGKISCTLLISFFFSFGHLEFNWDSALVLIKLWGLYDL